MLASAGLLAHPWGALRAQGAYPDRPLHFVVPQGPGGTGDTVSRLVAQRLAVRLGKPVVVENKAGAGGVLGTAIVAKAAPDGYSLVMASTGFATMEAMYSKLPFKPATDLVPVALMGSLPLAFLVAPDSPCKTVADFVERAKAQPGKSSHASAGIGSLSHLLAAWFKSEAGIRMNHVPYGSSAPALNALLSGQVDMILDPVATSAELVKAGRVRVLATTGTTRSKAIAAPTLIESGYPVHGAVWLGIMTTAGTPAALIDRLNTDINVVLQEPELVQQLQSRGFDIEPMTAAQFAAFVQSEMTTWSKIVRDNDIKPE
jgi:tripartite-type tricarboxylate transporter receptor subunit TctC